MGDLNGTSTGNGSYWDGMSQGNSTLDSVTEHPRASMEIDSSFIEDYTAYREVLSDCNTTLYTQHYPTDVYDTSIMSAIKQISNTNGGVYCNATWDTMQCWGFTKAGTTASQPCPAYITHSNPLAWSKKLCNSDGTWFRHPMTHRVWTNYSMCYDSSIMERHKQVLHMYYYGFGISIFLCVISLIIFSMFRQLQCVRVSLHKHLFVSYVLTGTLWILYYSLVLDRDTSDVLLHNPAWCQVLHVLTHYMTLCNYFWMFCEGFYLHALIVITFTRDKKLLYMCYVIGWVIPVVPALIYTIIRVKDELDNRRCWVEDNSNWYWILAGPINLSLVVNFFFTINIIRILLSKLRSVHNNETRQTWRAVRATLILIPLLGLQYIAIPFKPPPESDGEHVYSMISAFLVSFQGVCVSLVFCFFNGEVMKAMRKWWRRHKATRSNRFRKGSSASRHYNGETGQMMRSIYTTTRITDVDHRMNDTLIDTNGKKPDDKGDTEREKHDMDEDAMMEKETVHVLNNGLKENGDIEMRTIT